MSEGQYQNYQDFETQSSTFKKIPDVKIILFISVLIFGGVLYLQSINFGFREYWWVFAFGAVIIYILSLKQSTQNIEYIKIEVAREVLLQELLDYHALKKRKNIIIDIPPGEFEMGKYHLEINPRITDPQMYLYWEIGFSIKDRDDNYLEKYFLSWIDAKVGGLGVTNLKRLESKYNGTAAVKYLTRQVIVTPEKYAEIMSKPGGSRPIPT